MNLDEQRLEKLYQQLDALEEEGKPVPTALLDAIARLETILVAEVYK